jgi:prepilin-type N-terminal cleavage/methylation domain-containing protein
MKRRGLTLLELIVVLLVLVALAGIAVPLIDRVISGPAFQTPSGEKSALEIASETTMLRIREAIMGAGGNPGYYGDMRELPEYMEDLFVRPAGAADFDPNTRLGWRGPYLLTATGTYPANDIYGTKDAPAAIDAWGNPIVIQHPTSGDADYARLVSAGPDGVLNTPRTADAPSKEICADDVVEYLRIADPRPEV